jgi:hypothetical protein
MVAATLSGRRTSYRRRPMRALRPRCSFCRRADGSDGQYIPPQKWSPQRRRDGPGTPACGISATFPMLTLQCAAENLAAR